MRKERRSSFFLLPVSWFEDATESMPSKWMPNPLRIDVDGFLRFERTGFAEDLVSCRFSFPRRRNPQQIRERQGERRTVRILSLASRSQDGFRKEDSLDGNP